METVDAQEGIDDPVHGGLWGSFVTLRLLTGTGGAAHAPCRITIQRMAVRSKGFALEIERTLPAAPPVVFAAFADPKELVKWWGPEGFNVPSLDFDPRVGASYRIEMQPPEGDPFYLTGEFREADPPSRLVFTFAWEPPDPDDVETLVDLSFRDHGGSTEVAFAQGPFRTEERHALHQGGWNDSFDKLERLLSSER